MAVGHGAIAPTTADRLTGGQSWRSSDDTVEGAGKATLPER